MGRHARLAAEIPDIFLPLARNENSGMTMIFLIPAPRPATSHRPPYRHSGIFRRGASRDGKYPESPAPAGRKSARPRNNSQGYPTTPPTIPPKHRHSGIFRRGASRDGKYPESPAPAGRNADRSRNNSQGYPTTPPTIPPKHRHSGIFRRGASRDGKRGRGG